MVDEAKSHSDDDKKKRALAEARNKGDSLVYSAEKFLKDIGDKAPADLKSKIESQIAALRKTMESDNADAINKDVEELQKLQDELSQKMYAQAGAAGQGAGPGGPGGAGSPGGPGDGAYQQGSQQEGAGSAGGASNEDVIDAEFEAKDEK
jgi:molecular chaperone DnaK